MSLFASLEAILSTLDDAINVCYEVDSTSDDSERSYPFARLFSIYNERYS